jgi:hypothetical protein
VRRHISTPLPYWKLDASAALVMNRTVQYDA